jgi:hypothetical protein
MQIISLYQGPNHLEIVEQWNAPLLGLLAGVKKKSIVQILANRYSDIDYERWITFCTYYTIFACIYIFFISEWADTLKQYAKDIQETEVKKIHSEDKHKQTDMCIVQD